VLAQQPQGHLTETARDNKESTQNPNNKRQHKEKVNKNNPQK
jgi:hypothetical protein